MDIPVDGDGLIRRSEVIGRFTSDYRLNAEVGESLSRLWPGIYVNHPDQESLDREEMCRLTVIGAARTGGPDRVFSHDSAASLHRLPLLAPDRDRVHTTTPMSGRHTPRTVRHKGRLDPADRTEINGIAVTTLARTACDVARSGSFAQALTALDGALRLGVSREDLEAVTGRLANCKGISRLRQTLPLADGLSESVGESFARALILQMPDVPPPRLQVPINDGPEFVGRVDFLIAGRVVVEFDGFVKYDRAGGGAPPANVVFAEKKREDWLRDLGYEVVRLTWEDLLHPARAHAKIRRGLRRAGLLAA